MKLDLTTIPEGWWLYGLRHRHYLEENKYTAGEWECALQKYPSGGYMKIGVGTSPEEALKEAILQTKEKQL